MAEFNRAQRFFAGLDPGLSRFVAQQDQISARERDREAREVSAREERKNKFIQSALEAIVQDVSEGRREATPDLQRFIDNGTQRLSQNLGIEVPRVDLRTIRGKSTAAKDPFTRFQNRRDTLETELEGTTDPRQRQRLERNLQEVTQRMGEFFDKGLKTRVVGDNLVTFNEETGEILNQKQFARSPSQNARTEALFDVFAVEEGRKQPRRLGTFSRSQLNDFRGRPDILVQKVGSGSRKGLTVEVGKDGTVRASMGGSDVLGQENQSIGERNPIARFSNAMENTILNLEEASQRLRPGDVGISGELEATVFNRAIVPVLEMFGFDSEKRVDSTLVQNRQMLLQISEEMQRMMSQFPDRFSNEDVNRVNRMMIRPSATLTIGELRARMGTAIQFLEDKTRLQKQQLGRRTILDMDIDEILDAVDKGSLDENVARRVLSARFTREELDKAIRADPTSSEPELVQ